MLALPRRKEVLLSSRVQLRTKDRHWPRWTAETTRLSWFRWWWSWSGRGQSISLYAVECSTMMMTTRVSCASSQPNATRLEGGAQMPLLLGPFLPPSLPTSNCHPISTVPYLYPFLIWCLFVQQMSLAQLFWTWGYRIKRKITFALKERQPTAINSKDWESGTIRWGGQRSIPSRGNIRAKSWKEPVSYPDKVGEERYFDKETVLSCGGCRESPIYSRSTGWVSEMSKIRMKRGWDPIPRGFLSYAKESQREIL